MNDHEPAGERINVSVLCLRYSLSLDAARRSVGRTRVDRARPARSLLLEAETQVITIRCVHA